MSRFLFLLLFVWTSKTCSLNTDKGEVVYRDTLLTPTDSTALYFPIDSLQEKSSTRWYSFILFALREPILYNYSGEKTIYRFTWVRTFHHPVSIRVQEERNNVKLFLKILNGMGGYDPGRISLDSSFNISRQEWQRLQSLVVKSDFWNISTLIPDDGGFDGSEWILEGVSNSKYHWIHRWSPTYNNQLTPFRQICEYLLHLSKLQPPSNEYY